LSQKTKFRFDKTVANMLHLSLTPSKNSDRSTFQFRILKYWV